MSLLIKEESKNNFHVYMSLDIYEHMFKSTLFTNIPYAFGVEKLDKDIFDI